MKIGQHTIIFCSEETEKALFKLRFTHKQFKIIKSSAKTNNQTIEEFVISALKSAVNITF